MLKDWIRLVRPADWLKNGFVFAPLFFASQLFQLHAFLTVLAGAILFSLIASSIYILNDIRDRSADRMHAVKCKRPIASGKVSPRAAVILFVFMSIVGFIGALMLSRSFFYVIVLYYVINIAYCFYLKRIAIIDVYCIATGFILRVMSGAILIHVTPSVWILICTGLLALFLAFSKRRDDLTRDLDGTHRESIRGYSIPFIDVSITMTLSALFIAYTLYTTQNVSATDLGTTHFYWTVPLVLLGILRYLQITLVEKISDSPTTLLYKDKFLSIVVGLWIVMSGLLIYR